MIVKQLDVSYLDQINEMNQDKTTYAGVDLEKMPWYKPHLEITKSHTVVNYYLMEDNPYFKMWGYVDEDTNRLYSCMTQYFSPDTNMWYIQKALTNRVDRCESAGNMNGLVEVMEHAISYAEEREVYQYVMAYPMKYWLVHKRIWPKYVKQRQERYDSVVLNTIPAWTRPPYQDQWMWLMNSQPWPTDLVVTMQFLKPEYRLDPSATKDKNNN
jgi:hypothetical protein